MLKLNNLSCGYSHTPVIQNISFEILSTELLFVIGPNGSGKSTLLKTLFKLIPPIGGSFSQSLDLTPSLLEANPAAVFSMSVGELFKIKTFSNELTNEVIKLFKLEKLLDKDITTLSAGQAQYVWLAHILSLGSKLVFLDEPFTHLDWSHQNSLLHILKHFKLKHNTTFVISAHELPFAVEVADKIAVLNKGTLVLFGNVDFVFKNKIISEVFDFNCLIDENPLDGSKRLTIGKRND